MRYNNDVCLSEYTVVFVKIVDGGYMDLKFFQKKFKISLFSIGIFIFFLLVSLVSLFIVREKILDNSHIMGQEIAARFAIKETGRLKSQEMLLRSAAQNMAHLQGMKTDLSEQEIETALGHFTEYMENNAEVDRFDMCAVIDGKLIGKRLDGANTEVQNLKWYKAALANKGKVAYTNLYKYGKNNERVLTMAVCFGDNDVLAMNVYPERLNSLLADNKMPQHSYYYLCDPDGNIMFTINDRDMSIEAQQPYVDRIFKEIRAGNDDVSYITDYEGNKRGVYYTVSDKGWISIVTIPYDFLLGDYENLMQWFVLTLVVFLLLAAGMALREQLLNRQIEIFIEVTRVMSKSFLAVFRVNYATNRYYMLKADKIGFEPMEVGDYDELLAKLVTYVEPGAADEFAETFARSNIKELVEKHIYDFGGEFRQRFGKEYKWVNVRLVRDNLLKDNEAIFFFREVDAEKQKELEHLQVTEHALRVARENAKSRNMFFSAMSHDMRAPLNGIIGMAQLAELHKSDCGQVRDYIRKIRSSGEQLLTLINDILEMARLDNGKVEHVQETFSMAKVMRDTSDIFAAQAELEQKYFDAQILVSEDEMVSGDLQSLQQILNNVLSNALKYTKAQGTISFLVRQEMSKERNRASYSFIIKDTGCGMSEAFLKKIYNPFERDSRFGVPKVVGTGLGMTIVKSLVERMEGSIHISSRVDEGTCVIISLPFNLVKQAGETQSNVQPELKDFAGYKVLVAEDNDINMEIISELLTMNGLEVLPAADGKEAVELFKHAEEGSISMVLMDMQMPEMDGCEAAKAIRALKRSDSESVPILALTGNAGNDDIENAMASGMNDYMIKPLKMKLLAKKMSEYLQH